MTGIKFKKTRSKGDVVDFFFSDKDEKAYCTTDDEARWGINEIDYNFINISKDWDNGSTDYESWAMASFVHEIGHGLGLGHTGKYNKTVSFPNKVKFKNDSRSMSIMS